MNIGFSIIIMVVSIQVFRVYLVLRCGLAAKYLQYCGSSAIGLVSLSDVDHKHRTRAYLVLTEIFPCSLPALGYLMAALMFVAHIIVCGIWQKRR